MDSRSVSTTLGVYSAKRAGNFSGDLGVFEESGVGGLRGEVEVSRSCVISIIFPAGEPPPLLSPGRAPIPPPTGNLIKASTVFRAICSLQGRRDVPSSVT